MCQVLGRWLTKLMVVFSVAAAVGSTAQASTLLGMLFNEVNDIHLFRRGDATLVAVVQGRAWGWYHHVTFPINDNTGKQCLQKFTEYMNRTDNKQLQFGGYASGQIVDQPNRTTKSDITIITECYFR